MSNILKDSQIIIEKNPDLDKLFFEADKVINFHLNSSITPIEFFDSLSILGGEEFSKFLVFCLRNITDQEDLHSLFEEGISEELIERSKLLIAKYGLKFIELIDTYNNPYGTKSLSYRFIKSGQKNYMELELQTNNNNSILLHDEPAEYIKMFNVTLSRLAENKDFFSDEELDDFYNELHELNKQLKQF